MIHRVFLLCWVYDVKHCKSPVMFLEANRFLEHIDSQLHMSSKVIFTYDLNIPNNYSFKSHMDTFDNEISDTSSVPFLYYT